MINNVSSTAPTDPILPTQRGALADGINAHNFTSNINASGSSLSFTHYGNVDDPPPFSRGRQRLATILDLPQHLLLYIVQLSCLPSSRRGYCPQPDYRRFHFNPDAKGEYRGSGFLGDDAEYTLSDDEWSEHAIGLHHLAMNVRLVSRGLYVGKSQSFPTRPYSDA